MDAISLCLNLLLEIVPDGLIYELLPALETLLTGHPRETHKSAAKNLWGEIQGQVRPSNWGIWDSPWKIGVISVGESVEGGSE